MTARRWILFAVLLAAGLVAYLAWIKLRPGEIPQGFAGGNGRIEATEIDIATKLPGRIVAVFADEGDFTEVEQVLAQMDDAELKASLREAEAEQRRAKAAVETSQSSVSQRESEQAAAVSVVTQREAELDLANTKFERADRLFKEDATAKEDYDTNRAFFFSAKAAVSHANADVAAANAAIKTAKSQIIESEASVAAAEAKIERLQVEINDCTLKSPRPGRVQFRIAEPGEVLNSGGKVLNMVDLTDVYMTFFLPTNQAGQVRMGADARIVLDAAPHAVIPAKISFVSDVAQFTPKTVETADERQKLMFRIKARIDPKLLKEHIRSVKTGLPGMAYVQLDPKAKWPLHLEVKLPQ